MAVWLINDNLVHGAIRASNVMIDKDCSVHLVNYEYMQMPRSDAPDYESIRDADNVMVANLALGIKAVASDPAAFRYLRSMRYSGFPWCVRPCFRCLPMSPGRRDANRCCGSSKCFRAAIIRCTVVWR